MFVVYEQMRLKTVARFRLCNSIDLDREDSLSEGRQTGQDLKLNFGHATQKHLERSFKEKVLSFLMSQSFCTKSQHLKKNSYVLKYE